MSLIKSFSLFLLFFMATAGLHAQRTLSDDRFFFEYSVGGLFQLNSPQRVNSWFSLVDLFKNSPCVVLGGKCFWSKSWGVQMQMLMNASVDDAYFRDSGRVLENNRVEVTTGRIVGSFSIGPVYRCIFGKWTIQPYCNLGFTSFDNTEYSTYIEHIGSNDIDSFNMRMESVDRKSFSVAPGVQVARYLSKRMYLYAELSYLFNPGSSYGEYTLHNLYTQELIEKKRFKDACTDALQLRLGMSIRLF